MTGGRALLGWILLFGAGCVLFGAALTLAIVTMP
jgi:hypothetical protein